MKPEEVYSVAGWIFTHLNKTRPLELREVSIHEILYQIIMKKYGVDAKDECMKLILAAKKMMGMRCGLNKVSFR